MAVGSSQSFRQQMRANLIVQNLSAAIPSPLPASSTNTTSSVPTQLTSLGDMATLTAQGLINGYSFFSNITNKNAIGREQIASASIFLICMAQLGLAMYYFFSKIDCSTEDSAVCKTGLVLSALKIGLTVFASAGSELVKRSFAEEQAIKEEEAARRAERRNRQDPFLPPNMQMTFAPVFRAEPPPPSALWRLAP